MRKIRGDLRLPTRAAGNGLGFGWTTRRPASQQPHLHRDDQEPAAGLFRRVPIRPIRLKRRRRAQPSHHGY